MISTLIWLAVLPSALLIYRVLKSDKVESEPPRLIIRVFLLGAASCFPAALLETFGETLVTNIVSTQAMYSALMFLFVVPAAEEFVKFLAMCSIRKRPEFNYTFDGIVYGVAASLGFATLENLFYVLGEGSYTVAIMRGVLSVPLHCTCGVFMGYYYGLTQWYRAHGQKSEASKSQTLTLLVPIIIHGLYDYSLYDGSLRSYHHTTDSHSLAHDYATSLATTSDGRLLVGTLRGLCVMNDQTAAFSHWNTSTPDCPMPSDFIHCLLTYGQRLWIGTETAGVVCLTRKPLLLRNYVNLPHISSSLSPHPVKALDICKFWVDP